MRILLTNDDGIGSPGLRRLAETLEPEHEVWIVAPEGNRSGSSHSITLGTPTRFRQASEREYVCWGTPADCVLVAILGLVAVEIELVLSGLNLGPNLGTDIVYSGTAAAARQGAFMGKPAVACSLSAFVPPYHLDYAALFIARNLELLRSLWAEDHFLNINFPNGAGPSRPQVTYPTRRIYKDKLVRFEAPNGDLYAFLGGQKPGGGMEEGSDYWAIEQGFCSLSPILIHPTNHEIEERYRNARFWSQEAD
jgi:5'-nucleotidase